MEVDRNQLNHQEPPISEDEAGDSEETSENYNMADSPSLSHSETRDDQSEAMNGQPGKMQTRKKRERRSKDDNSKRNYVCGCGKMYLSYAALYTHAKVKHNGVFPEGTTTLHKKKQGRPKVVACDLRRKRTPSQSR